MAIKSSQAASNLRRFGERMIERAAVLRQEAYDLPIAVTKKMADEVIQATPVDTGKARSNWQASVTDQNATVLDPYAPGRHLGRGETDNARAARSQVATALKEDFIAIADGATIFLQNNTPYIRDLNKGTSSQNQNGKFVEAAVANAGAFIRQYKWKFNQRGLRVRKDPRPGN